MLIQSPPLLFAFGMPGGMEWIVLLVCPFPFVLALIALVVWIVIKSIGKKTTNETKG